MKHYRDNIERNHQIYSYERANAFNRDIKKLGLTNTGESFLDQFRKLISHIGNSMGYVRMIRSGCNHVCANASVCLPALDDDLMFVELCKDNGLSGTTLRAAEHLEEDIQQLSKNYSEGTLYFKVNTKNVFQEYHTIILLIFRSCWSTLLFHSFAIPSIHI